MAAAVLWPLPATKLPQRYPRWGGRTRAGTSSRFKGGADRQSSSRTERSRSADRPSWIGTALNCEKRGRTNPGRFRRLNESFMMQPVRILVMGILMLALIGCGRKGPLDLPPAAASDQRPGNTAQGPAFGPGDRPIVAPRKKEL